MYVLTVDKGYLDMKIGNYEISKADDLQFKLEEHYIGKDKDGNDKEMIKFIGYYGYLDQLLNKILNMKALDSIDDVEYTQNLLDRLLALYGSITSAYHYRPKDM